MGRSPEEAVWEAGKMILNMCFDKLPPSWSRAISCLYAKWLQRETEGGILFHEEAQAEGQRTAPGRFAVQRMAVEGL